VLGTCDALGHKKDKERTACMHGAFSHWEGSGGRHEKQDKQICKLRWISVEKNNARKPLQVDDI
jgi:hypothetical protein